MPVEPQSEQPAPVSKPGGTFGALRHARFRWVWAASLVSQTGDWFLITGRAFLVYEITESTAALGAIYFFSLIPLLLFSQVSGVLADRFERRRILLISQLLATLSSVGIGVLAQSGTATLVNLCALAFVYGTIQTVTGPAQQAAIPALVPREDLSSAISLQSSTTSASRIIGPALAGAILPVVGSGWLFYLNAISFVFVIIAWYVIKLPRQPEMHERRALHAALDGLRFARNTPAIAVPLLASAIVGGIGLSYAPHVAAYASDLLAHGDETRASHYYGLLQTAIGLGALFGVMMLPRFSRSKPGPTLVVGVLGFGCSLALFGAFPSTIMSLIVCVFLGGTQFATGAHALSLIQHHSPEVLRGRLISLYTVAFAGLFPIIGYVGGYIASHVGLKPVLTVTGIACVIAGLPLISLQRYVAVPDRSEMHAVGHT